MRCNLGFVTEMSVFRSAIKVKNLVEFLGAGDRVAAPDFGNMSNLIRLVGKKKATIPSVSLRIAFNYEMKSRSFDAVHLFAYSKDAYRVLCEMVTLANQHIQYEPRISVSELNARLANNPDLYAIIDPSFGYADLLDNSHGRIYVACNASTDLNHPTFRLFAPIYFHLSHAIKKEDFKILDSFASEFEAKNVDRELYWENDAHFLAASGVPDAVENYQFLFQKEFTTKPIELAYKLPSFSEGAEDLFLALTKAGFEQRYPNPTPQQRDRLEYEIAMILQMGFASYFLIVWDFIDWSKQNGIAVGPGRGSAAGSIVAYCLGITQLCPLEHDLYFERFLNPERISLPDIDVDFSQSRRQEVIRYLESRYTQERVAQIITFSKMKSKTAFKDSCRANNIPAEEANSITKLWPPDKFGISATLDEVYKFEKIRDWVENNHQHVWQQALEIEGFVRHGGVHAAGVIIAPSAITDYAPYTSKDAARMCQFDKDDSEKFGLLKMDLLGLKNLDILQNAAKYAGIDFYSLYDMPLDDPVVYERFQEADTHGVFQFESRGMQELLRKIQPTCFGDITAATALYRPGPLQSGLADQYVRNKHSLVQEATLIPEFKTILADTYCTFVYQEQIMRIAQEIAGFTMAKADTLRKAIGKKDHTLMAKMSSEFINGSVERGQNREAITTVWEQIEKFGDYCFNKSHSAAYSLISYYCMWFKVYHPTEYALALLTADMGDSSKMAAHFFHVKKDVQFTYPLMGKCKASYSVYNNTLMIGLGSVKEIGNPDPFLLEFTSLTHFLESAPLDKTKLEQLIKAGFFDEVESDREVLLANVPEMLAYSKNSKSRKRMLLFDIETTHGFSLNYAKRKRVSRTSQEFDAFGFNIHEGFVVKHARVIETFKTNTMALTITEVRRVKTARSGEDMAILKGYTNTGEASVTVFPRVYKIYGNRLMTDKTYLIEYEVTPANDKYEESFVMQRCMDSTDFVPAALILKDENGFRTSMMKRLPVLSSGRIPVFYEGETLENYESKQAGFIDVLNDEYLDSLPHGLTPITRIFLDERR